MIALITSAADPSPSRCRRCRRRVVIAVAVETVSVAGRPATVYFGRRIVKITDKEYDGSRIPRFTLTLAVVVQNPIGNSRTNPSFR